MIDRVHLGVLSPGSIAVRATGDVALGVVAAQGVGFSVELARLRGLIDALKAAGVAVVGTRAVHDALRAHESAIDVSVTAAIEARLAERGLAPYPYQREGIAWLMEQQRGLLGDEPGLGKTQQLLCAAPLDPLPPVVVVAPALAKTTWRDETRLWRPDLTPAPLHGRGSFRWARPGEVVITNPELLPPCEREVRDLRSKARKAADEAKKLTRAGKDPAKKAAEAEAATAKADELERAVAAVPAPPEGTILIADEAHDYMSPKSQRTKRMRALVVQVLERGGRVWPATGTPGLGKPEGRWCVLETFKLATLAFGRWPDFVRLMEGRQLYRWATIKDKSAPKGYRRVKKPAGFGWGTPLPAARDCLRKVQLRRLKRDVLTDLPPKRRQRLVVELSPATVRLCDEGRRALAARGIDLERATLEALENAEKLPEFHAYAEACAALAAAKLDAVLDLVERYEAAETPLAVFSRHRAPIDALAAREGWGGIVGGMTPAARDEVRHGFQEGRLRGVAYTIGAGGVALTLTRAEVVIAVDRAFSPALNDQAEDRAHRIGQKGDLLVVDVVAEHALDERQDELLAERRERLDALETAEPAPAPRECRPEPPRTRRAVSKTKDLSGIGPLFDGAS